MNINSETKITCTCNNGEIREFSVYSLSRWICLLEALDHIQTFADEHNLDIEKHDFLKKPASLFEYINAKQPKIEETILGCIRKYGVTTERLMDLM